VSERLCTETCTLQARGVNVTTITRERPSTERSRADRKAQTRRQLLDAALGLVAERGFAALSLRELTRQVGITPAAFYRHFANLDELGLVLVEESFGALGGMLREARADRTPPEHLIDASIDLVVRHVRAKPLHFRFVSRELAGGHHAIRQAIRKELQLFRSELAVDLARLPYVREWATDDLYVLADLIVQTMVSTVAELLDLDPDDGAGETAVAEAARTKLLLIVLGVPHFRST
jgi:AcrR family transcriptional regulator